MDNPYTLKLQREIAVHKESFGIHVGNIENRMKQMKIGDFLPGIFLFPKSIFTRETTYLFLGIYEGEFIVSGINPERLEDGFSFFSSVKDAMAEERLGVTTMSGVSKSLILALYVALMSSPEMAESQKSVIKDLQNRIAREFTG